MNVCFIGHKKINISEELISSLKETIMMLIDKGVTTFLFGSGSEFNDLAWKIVTELKSTYQNISRVYVRATHQNLNNFYEEYLLKLYEETYFPPQIQNSGKYSYIERNQEMIDKSTYCVFYYDESYIPAIKRQPKHTPLKSYQRSSGTKIAYAYAVKKEKHIINLFK